MRPSRAATRCLWDKARQALSHNAAISGARRWQHRPRRLFDTKTGAFIRHSTHQGWRDDSSWARGLTWAIYGFGSAYQFTGDRRFLQTAEACAAYYIEGTAAHGLPPNDWTEPEPAQPYESSAAAIAASAFLQLSELSADPVRARMYQQYAFRILDTLLGPTFLAIETPNWEGILKGGHVSPKQRLGRERKCHVGRLFLPGGAHGRALEPIGWPPSRRAGAAGRLTAYGPLCARLQPFAGRLTFTDFAPSDLRVGFRARWRRSKHPFVPDD